ARRLVPGTDRRRLRRVPAGRPGDAAIGTTGRGAAWPNSPTAPRATAGPVPSRPARRRGARGPECGGRTGSTGIRWRHNGSTFTKEVDAPVGLDLIVRV